MFLPNRFGNFQVITVLFGIVFKNLTNYGMEIALYKVVLSRKPPVPTSCPFHKQVYKPGKAQYHYSVAGVSWEVFYLSGSLDLSFGHTYSVLMMSNVHTSALIQTWALPEFEICMDKVCADGPEF